MKSTIIIKLSGKTENDLHEALIEVIKSIINHGGAAGRGRNSEGTEFEFALLQTDTANRRNAFERSMALSQQMLEFAKELVDAKQISSPIDEALHELVDRAEQDRINAANAKGDDNDMADVPDEAIAAMAAKAIAEAIRRAEKASKGAEGKSQPEGGQNRPEGGTLH